MMAVEDQFKKYKLDSALLELPFDQFGRQFIAKLIVEARRTKPRLKILDVGGYKGKTAAFFPDDEVTIVDIFDVTEPGYVKASGLELPFENGAFDAVLSFDVFEHIPEEDRARFVADSARVSRDVLLLAAPFETNDARMVGAAEAQLNALYHTLNGTDHQWLKEHIDNGLPTVAKAEQMFGAAGLTCTRLASSELGEWQQMQAMIFLAVYVVTNGITELAFRDFNRQISPVVNSDVAAYRQVFCVSKAKAFDETELQALFGHGATPDPHDFQDQLTTGEIVSRALAAMATQQHDRLADLQASAAAQQEILVATQRHAQNLQAQLDNITRSKAWKLVNVLRSVKQRGMGPRKGAS